MLPLECTSHLDLLCLAFALAHPRASRSLNVNSSAAFDPVAEEDEEDVYGSIMNTINTETEDVYSQVLYQDDNIYQATGAQDKRSMVVRTRRRLGVACHATMLIVSALAHGSVGVNMVCMDTM